MRTFEFLALPLELRVQVYTELLCPEPTKIKRLYHDKEGRSHPLHLYPSILCANKQINREASSFLYDSNVFELYFASEYMPFQMHISTVEPPPPWGALSKTTRQSFFERPVQADTVNSQTIERLRHLRIVVKEEALLNDGWLNEDDCSAFTSVGGYLLNILRLISVEKPESGSLQKTLLVEVMSTVHQGTPSTRFFHAEWYMKPHDKIFVKILGYMKSIAQRRNLVVEEHIEDIVDGQTLPPKMVSVDLNNAYAHFLECRFGHRPCLMDFLRHQSLEYLDVEIYSAFSERIRSIKRYSTMRCACRFAQRRGKQQCDRCKYRQTNYVKSRSDVI